MGITQKLFRCFSLAFTHMLWLLFQPDYEIQSYKRGRQAPGAPVLLSLGFIHTVKTNHAWLKFKLFPRNTQSTKSTLSIISTTS